MAGDQPNCSCWFLTKRLSLEHQSRSHVVSTTHSHSDIKNCIITPHTKTKLILNHFKSYCTYFNDIFSSHSNAMIRWDTRREQSLFLTLIQCVICCTAAVLNKPAPPLLLAIKPAWICNCCYLYCTSDLYMYTVQRWCAHTCSTVKKDDVHILVARSKKMMCTYLHHGQKRWCAHTYSTVKKDDVHILVARSKKMMCTYL